MSSADQVPPSQGLVGGKYELVRLIGRGGMGSVWEAKHTSLGTPSAIKFIEAEYADSQEARSRFDKEAKAAATIQSKHAIQIYDHGVTEDGKPYIVMELLQGEPLDKVIDRGPLPLTDTARILQQVCKGLQRAHDHGIVHRDLKPENIFLVKTAEDDEAIAKVLDFGIAKIQTGTASALTSSTKTGAVLGTPFYMSPEQARGLRNVDHRADLWSIGVIAFKCVIGKLPFDGESVGDLLVKICTAPVPLPSQVGASLGLHGISPNFDAWFVRALEREPERRFSSAAELAEALCFAAGIAPRGQGAPISSGGVIPTPNPGIMTPVNAGMGYAAQTPNAFGGSGGSGGGSGAGHSPTAPSPAAMTNAPFTSESIPGVSSGKSKLFVGLVAVVMAAVGVVGGVTFLKRGTSVQPDATNGVGVVAAAAALASSASSTGTLDKPAEPLPAASAAPPPPGAGAGAGAVAAKDAPAPAPPPGPAKPGKTSSGSKQTKQAVAPLPPVPATTTAQAAAPPPPPPPAPAPKKPAKNDPGY